jgi:hypothetical protein
MAPSKPPSIYPSSSQSWSYIPRQLSSHLLFVRGCGHLPSRPTQHRNKPTHRPRLNVTGSRGRRQGNCKSRCRRGYWNKEGCRCLQRLPCSCSCFCTVMVMMVRRSITLARSRRKRSRVVFMMLSQFCSVVLALCGATSTVMVVMVMAPTARRFVGLCSVGIRHGVTRGNPTPKV